MLLSTLAMVLLCQAFAQGVFVEAESFDTKGGWSVDQQFNEGGRLEKPKVILE